jgi:hypothetical protein
MPLISQVRFPRLSAPPEDDIVHTWNWGGPDAINVIGALRVFDRLQDFYSLTIGPSDGSPNDYLANYLNMASASCKIYNFADPEPRTPLVDQFFSFATSPLAPNDLPAELATCISYHAAFESGEPPARRRGRVYFGPCNAAAMIGGSTSAADIPVGVQIMEDMIRSLDALLGLNDGLVDWAVWSRADNEFRTVVAGWMDNAWDIQRRRGARATARFNF